MHQGISKAARERRARSCSSRSDRTRWRSDGIDVLGRRKRLNLTVPCDGTAKAVPHNLVLGRILPVFSVVAPCQTGASPVSVPRWTFTTDC